MSHSDSGWRIAGVLIVISLLSSFGSTAMSLVSRIWILDPTGSSSRAALAALCVYLRTLLAPWWGGLIDRRSRRRLLIGVNLGLGAVMPSLLLVHSAAQVDLIFAALLAYGVGYVLLDASETALMPAAALGSINGLRSSARLGGPTALVAAALCCLLAAAAAMRPQRRTADASR